MLSLDHDDHVPLENYARLLQRTVIEMGDEIVGYGRAPYKRGIWRNACRAALQMGSLGQALERLCEFYSLFDAGPQMQLVVSGKKAKLNARPPAANISQDLFVYELALATFHRFASWAIGRRLPLSAVTFTHEAPAYANDYGWLFQNCPILFDNKTSSLCFDLHWLYRPLTQNHLQLELWLDRSFAGLFVPDESIASWSKRIFRILERDFPALPDFHTAAKELHIHPQALRRRLALEGFTYQDIKDQTHRRVAEYYLTETILPIDEVAIRAGYSEASCFIRAFKRWHGITPSTYSKAKRKPD